MTIATGIRSKVGYVVETVYGTTPASPSLIELPFTDFTVNLNRDEHEDTSIRSDRMERYSLSGKIDVNGNIDVNFAAGTYDTLIESLLQSSFTADVIKTGSTRKSLTVEEAQVDIAQYRVYTGLIVDKADFTIPANGIVTAKFTVMGKDQSVLTSTSIDADGYTPSEGAMPFADNSVTGFIKEGALSVGYITDLQFSIDNGHAKNYAIGAPTVRDFTSNMEKITGTMQVFFEDAVMYNKFVNGTSSSIDVKLDNGVDSYQFFFPNVKYTGATKSIKGGGPVTLSMPFKALYDTTSGSNIVITRS